MAQLMRTSKNFGDLLSASGTQAYQQVRATCRTSIKDLDAEDIRMVSIGIVYLRSQHIFESGLPQFFAYARFASESWIKMHQAGIQIPNTRRACENFAVKSRESAMPTKIQRLAQPKHILSLSRMSDLKNTQVLREISVAGLNSASSGNNFVRFLQEVLFWGNRLNPKHHHFVTSSSQGNQIHVRTKESWQAGR